MRPGALASGLMVEPAPPRFTLAVPDNWIALDLDPRTRTESIARMVAERVGEGQRELTATLRQYARQAANQGAAYAALMYQLVDGVLLSASLLVARGAAPRDHDGRPVLEPAGLGGVLGASLGGGAEVAEFGTLAGPMARARRVGGQLAQTQYAVAVPGTDLIVSLAFSTPNLALAQPLNELFDAIARTFRWVAA
jgi:hypothetical protein